MDFKDKVAVVTGAASGMGAATAKLFAEAGAQLIIVDKNKALARAIEASIPTSQAFIGDISDSAFCNSVIEATTKQFGRCDVLVNAAGVITRKDSLATTDDDWQRVMNVNVNGLFYMSRASLKVMKVQGSGAIVNFGSIWGGLGATGVIAYCASKGAVHQITKAMALEYIQDGIRVNAVCPGEVNTPMLASERSEPVTPDMMQAIANSVPMGRLAEPEEIAKVVLFLASDKASYMTGTLVNVDAGYTAQ